MAGVNGESREAKQLVCLVLETDRFSQFPKGGRNIGKVDDYVYKRTRLFPIIRYKIIRYYKAVLSF